MAIPLMDACEPICACGSTHNTCSIQSSSPHPQLIAHIASNVYDSYYGIESMCINGWDVKQAEGPESPASTAQRIMASFRPGNTDTTDSSKISVSLMLYYSIACSESGIYRRIRAKPGSDRKPFSYPAIPGLNQLFANKRYCHYVWSVYYYTKA